MKRKRSSPSVSENEFDISGALTGDLDIETPEDGFDFDSGKGLDSFDASMDLEEDESDGDGDEAFIAAQQAASNRKASNLKGRTVKKGGGFQSMGLNAVLFKAITRKGFSVPTPIQRKTIPLIMDGQDVVGMARTGSGKTAAFVIPMIEKLKAHSAKVGARAIILSPSRELALQTRTVIKEMAKGTDLRTVLLVGGDSLEEQFDSMTWNPDIIIATPGRFHHLKVEMKLDLSSVQYIVFDEADRLFEMGFAVQLTEIIHGLPTNRQSLLFSATLPKSLVEFARAGLQDPTLVRLDADSKISPNLESAFFTIKSSSKEGALLEILQNVIKMPTVSNQQTSDSQLADAKFKKKKKKKSNNNANKEAPSPFSTIVFAATKHRVEYLVMLLRMIGYPVSYVYGALDQTARKIQILDFRQGNSTILVTTDVAARGIDIPILANVINYDFPSQPKVFVHRVGRTARAKSSGWSYSLVHDSDLPYLLDLQLFLSRKLVIGTNSGNRPNFAEEIVLGAFPTESLGASSEWVEKLVRESADLTALRGVAARGEKLYTKTRNPASIESVKRSKSLATNHSMAELNPLFADSNFNSLSAERDNILARLRQFRPVETIFEIGKRGVVDDKVETFRKARSTLDKSKRNHSSQAPESLDVLDNGTILEKRGGSVGDFDEEDDEEDLEIEVGDYESNFEQKGSTSSKPWEESDHFMSYTPRLTNLAEDKGYGVHSGASGRSSDFLLSAQDASIDLTNDELKGFGLSNRPKMRWDKKGRKYVNTANDQDGSRGAKMVKGESGLKIAASLRSGRFDAWRRENHIRRMPRVGEDEAPNKQGEAPWQTKRFKHKADRAPREADKFRDDYHSQKKKVAQAKENRIGKYRDGVGKNELRSVDDIRKQRNLKEKRRARTGRPSKKSRF